MSQTSRLSLPFETGEISLPETGLMCFYRAVASELPLELDFDRCRMVQSFKPQNDRLAGLGVRDAASEDGQYSMAVVQITRSRSENQALVARAYRSLAEGGLLVIDGAKTDGIESLLKAVKKRHAVDAPLSKAHGKVFWLTRGGSGDVFPDWETALEPRTNNDGYWTAAGMFSEDHIDKGSALLAPHLENKLSGKGADLGAGWGYLSGQCLAVNEKITALDLYEAEDTALNCARLNVTDTRATFHWQDVTAVTRKNTYDFIVMNPPFHQSRRADPALGQSFVRRAAQMLHQNGKLFMVANRQLAYEATLGDCFRHFEEIEITPQFKCIFARKPKP